MPLSSQAMEHREKRIVVETARHRITGVLRLPRDGYRSRLTDYLNASERTFLPLTEVEITPLNGSGEPERRPYTAVSVSHVVLAMPADADDPEDDGKA
jgi:Family of unknown function (DUF6812)